MNDWDGLAGRRTPRRLCRTALSLERAFQHLPHGLLIQSATNVLRIFRVGAVEHPNISHFPQPRRWNRRRLDFIDDDNHFMRSRRHWFGHLSDKVAGNVEISPRYNLAHDLSLRWVSTRICRA